MTKTAPTALAIRHLAFEDLGLIQPLLTDRGYTVRYLDAGIDTIDVEAVEAADLLVVLGGPIGANDGDRYPFLAAEIDAVRSRLSTGGRTDRRASARTSRRTLGICLGAQLIAVALGAKVTASGHAEIGYAPLTLTPEGLDSPLRHLADVPVLHWHYDRSDLPDGAALLASTPHTPNQAFAAGPDVLALQFHLETPHRDLERWLIGHAGALASADIHPDTIRHAAAAAAPTLADAATRAITEWLDAGTPTAA